MALSIKQRIFVETYLTNGFNATKAAIAAGYSERTARQIGYENLTKPDIRSAIEMYLAEITLSREEILVRVADLARADFADFLTIKEVPDLAKLLSRPEPKEGEERPPVPMETVAELDLLKAVEAGKTYAIEAVEHGKYGLKIKIHDKLKALELAGRAKGMFKDEVKHSGAITVSRTPEDLTDDELAAIATGGSARAAKAQAGA